MAANREVDSGEPIAIGLTMGSVPISASGGCFRDWDQGAITSTMREIKSYDGYNYLLCDGEDPEGNVFQLMKSVS